MNLNKIFLTILLISTCKSQAVETKRYVVAVLEVEEPVQPTSITTTIPQRSHDSNLPADCVIYCNHALSIAFLIPGTLCLTEEIECSFETGVGLVGAAGFFSLGSCILTLGNCLGSRSFSSLDAGTPLTNTCGLISSSLLTLYPLSVGIPCLVNKVEEECFEVGLGLCGYSAFWLFVSFFNIYRLCCKK